MIVTIDGPAGAGKSAVAKALAQRLGYRFLDTGAMYRAVVWAVMQQGIEWNNAEGIVATAEQVRIELVDGKVIVNDHDVTSEIRAPEIGQVIHHVADIPQVRAVLVRLQRELTADGNFVSEGRDQGTVAFPNANWKFFLTASPDERARRRVEQLRTRGRSADLEDVLRQQNDRDLRDESRPVGGLKCADDAERIVSDGMSLEKVVEFLATQIKNNP